MKGSLTLEESNLSLLESTLSSRVKHLPKLEGLNPGPLFHIETPRLGGPVSLAWARKGLRPGQG